jgi:ankyrin repeat protein
MCTTLFDLCMAALESRTEFSSIQQWMDERKESRELLSQAANFRNDKNTTPLHLLACKHPPLDLLKRVIQLAPDTLKVQDFEGRLPVHLACAHTPSIEKVKVLLDSYPESTQVTNQSRCLSLHTALKNKASFEVVRILLNNYPKAAEVPDNNGLLPLHYACQVGASYESLQILVDAYPEGLSKTEKHGYLPWQLLQSSGAAALCDVDGMFPLHHACYSGASLHLLKLLFDAYPECIKKTDNNNKTPSDYFKRV